MAVRVTEDWFPNRIEPDVLLVIEMLGVPAARAAAGNAKTRIGTRTATRSWRFRRRFRTVEDGLLIVARDLGIDAFMER